MLSAGMFIQNITVFTLSIGTSYILTMLFLKFGKIHLITFWCVRNIAGWVANSVDPDQMQHSVASDLGLHCLLRHVFPNT